MKKLIIFMSLFLLASCTVRFPQVESAINMFSSAPDPLQGMRWQLIMANYKTTMLAINVPNGTVFANEQDDALFFDGVAIRRIVKLGARTDRYEILDRIEGDKTYREYSINGRVFAEHPCEKPVLIDADRSEQSCQAQQAYLNVISFNKAGNIVGISQVVDYTGQVLELRKL